jgi:hypothetical protein
MTGSESKNGRRAKRARLPFCWVCSRKLAMGGWLYATIKDSDGVEHDVHRACVGDYTPVPETA